MNEQPLPPMSGSFGVRVRSGDEKFYCLLNVRGLFFTGEPRETAQEAALDADVARFWFRRHGLLKNRVRPNFPELWDKWHANLADAPSKPSRVGQFLERSGVSRAEHLPVSGALSVSSAHRVPSTQILKTIEVIREVLAESPSRVTDETRGALVASATALKELL